MVIFALIVYEIGAVFFCGWLAGAKGRNMFAWGLLGAIFGLLALLAIAAMPLEKDEVAPARPESGRRSPAEEERLDYERREAARQAAREAQLHRRS